MAKKISVGSCIIPKIGTYRGQRITVSSVSTVKRGSRDLGTKRGQTIYFTHRGLVYYRRKDFKVCKNGS